jgi:hypothetical protein
MIETLSKTSQVRAKGKSLQYMMLEKLISFRKNKKEFPTSHCLQKSMSYSVY